GDRRSCTPPGDVCDFRACGAIVRSATDRFGRVDILVNNAGIFSLRKVADMEPRDWESIFRVHVFGAFNMIRHVLPGMLERKRGVIVNIASFVAVRPPGPGRVHYASAKAALFGLTRALGLEVAQDGVRVVGVAPGLTDTEIVRQGLPNLAERVSQVPLGRMARPEEIAHTVRYAIENDFLTAETIFVAGGEWPHSMPRAFRMPLFGSRIHVAGIGIPRSPISCASVSRRPVSSGRGLNPSVPRAFSLLPR